MSLNYDDLAQAPQSLKLSDVFATGSVNQATFDAIEKILGNKVTVGMMDADGNVLNGTETNGKAQVVFVPSDQPLMNAPSAKSGVTTIIMTNPETTAAAKAVGDPANANLFLDASSKVSALIMNNENDNQVIFTNDEVNAVVTTGTGNGTIVYTAGGNDTVTVNGAANSTATVNTGEGDDVVFLEGNGGSAVIGSGSGDLVVRMNTTAMNATIDAGDGFDYIRTGKSIGLDGQDLAFDEDSGQFTMTNTDGGNGQINMTNVNMVVFDPFQRGTITWQDDVSVLADNWNESIIAKLYNVALGRTVLDGRDGVLQADGDALSGIQFWDSYIAANPGIDAQQLAVSFLDCAQFHTQTDDMTNAQFVKYLFNNLDMGVKDSVTDNAGAAHTYQSYVDALDAAGATSAENMDVRYETALQIANSQSTVEVLGADGKQYIIDGDFSDPLA